MIDGLKLGARGRIRPWSTLRPFLCECKRVYSTRGGDVGTPRIRRPIDSSNKGRKMLEKMGWKDGSGLGADEIGIAEPVCVAR